MKRSGRRLMSWKRSFTHARAPKPPARRTPWSGPSAASGRFEYRIAQTATITPPTIHPAAKPITAPVWPATAASDGQSTRHDHRRGDGEPRVRLEPLACQGNRRHDPPCEGKREGGHQGDGHPGAEFAHRPVAQQGIGDQAEHCADEAQPERGRQDAGYRAARRPEAAADAVGDARSQPGAGDESGEEDELRREGDQPGPVRPLDPGDRDAVEAQGGEGSREGQRRKKRTRGELPSRLRGGAGFGLSAVGHRHLRQVTAGVAT